MIPVPPPREPPAKGPADRVKRVRSDLSGLVVSARIITLSWLKSRWAIRCEGGAAKALRQNDLVIVTPFYGNNGLLPPFLQHHRRLGVDQFVFLDLSEIGGLAERLADQRDCAIWRPGGRTAKGQAIYWLNYLRRRYGTGRWCLSLEPNEMFVFPRSESRQIKDLTEFLQSEARDHIFALVVEMYGDQPAKKLVKKLASKTVENPLNILSYFDPYGYTTSRSHHSWGVTVRGGVQRRTVFRDSPRRSPPLNRIPLVKWRWFYTYVAGTRLLIPRRLNAPHPPWHSAPTACLLRFALLDDHASFVAAAMAEAGQISARPSGAQYYRSLLKLRRHHLKHNASVRFNSSADLVECGLLNPGQWF
jgi:hypothetical protein